ncbi:MAG: 4-(cytidine 5'-diphospho)-2-C-methyl-D-erythritol kinase, partial [Treponema sp.]|nr:4-(cytidine 5'-diphospho)-2-C-methyl-D-erythritol kinase [Treponema sp.]
EKNIIFQALSLFREKTGFKQGFKITTEKRIPMGGGLGGGSSNAAATILALNRQAGFPLSREELLGMASALGSDVPFFVYETGAAWVTGRGEHIRPVKVPDLFFVLVNPGFSSDTARAFKLLDEYPENYRLGDRARKVNLFSASGHFYGINFESFHNDFLPVFNEPEKSVYNSIISQLYELGADFANLSGAGSTCFGVFSKREQAEKASENLHDKWSFVKCCKIKSDF